MLYQLSVPDECAIQRERAQLHFEQVDSLFQFIEDNTFPVLVLSQRLNGETEDAPTLANEIYETAKKRGFFVREDWRRIQPYILNLLKSSRSQPPFNDCLVPTFDPDCGLTLWTGKYLAGLNGIGIKEFGQEDYMV